MRNVRILMPPDLVAAAAYLKESTAASLPEVYVALVEMGVNAAPLAELVAPVGKIVDRRAQAATRAVKSKPKGGEK